MGMCFQLKNLLRRFRISFSDKLRFSTTLRQLVFFWQFRLRTPSVAPDSAEAALRLMEHLCRCARLAVTSQQLADVEGKIERMRDDAHAICKLLAEDAGHDIRKAAILKPYCEDTGERGVVFISFEYQWQNLLSMSNREEFASRYDLVVSPTWTPPHSPLNCTFPEVWPQPVYTLISNLSDLDTFPRLSSKYRVIKLFASSWVNPDLFASGSNQAKDIDLLMLANFGVYKRHHVLFRALRDLPRDWKVVLVGQPNGARTAEVLLSEAEAFGVRDRLELRQRVTDEEVCDLLSRARMSLICSKREGSCVAVVESMFANTPVGLLKGAGIGSGAFVNEHTGGFLDEGNLANELLDLHKRAENMNPREWCLSNGVDCRSSSEHLNQVLAEAARSQGLPWSRDIARFHWRPDPVLLDLEDEVPLAEERKRLEELTGVRFGVN